MDGHATRPESRPTQPEPANDAFVPRQQTRRERLRGPLVTGALVGGLTVALHFRDPHSSGSWGFCPFYALTGIYCPGCGGLRAVNDLTNGDLVAAASSNLVFVAMVPLVVFLWVRWAGRAWSGTPAGVARQHAGVWIALLVVVLLVFTVLRNLPMGSWLAP
jgi:Protein of unknown function (DUF2752)